MYKESEIIELKREYTADIRKEIIAFANTNGGTIYVGIDDNGDIVGIDDCDALMLKIGNLVRDSIKPDITAFIHYDNLVEHDKNILKIRFYNKCWGDTTTVSLPTLFFCKKISI